MNCPNCDLDFFTPTCPTCGYLPEQELQISNNKKYLNSIKKPNEINKPINSNNQNNKIVFDLKCPNCGGELNLSNKNKPVKCSYCNSTIIIKDDEYKNNSSLIEINNLMELAKSAEKSNNYLESYKYYTKILEYDIENISAWHGKGISTWHISSDITKRIKEMITCFEKVKDLNCDIENQNNISIFLFEKCKEFYNTDKKYDNFAQMSKKNNEGVPQVIQDSIEKYNDLLVALELSWKLSPKIDIGEYIINICFKILSSPIILKFDNTLSTRTQNIFYKKIDDLKNLDQNWQPNFLLKLKIYSIKNKQYFYFGFILVLIIIIFLIYSIVISNFNLF